MPEDVGGQPSKDGEEPEDRHHGDADEEFASVVFDEDFVRAAEVHEPTAAERTLAAAQSHAESESRAYEDGYGFGAGHEEDGDAAEHFRGYPYAPPGTDPGRGTTYGFGYGSPYDDPVFPHDDEDVDGLDRPYRGHARWQRPVAWVLAVVMGIGVVALAFSAVYRGASGQRQEPSPPPATTGVDGSGSRGQPGTLPGGTPAPDQATATAHAGRN